MAKSISPQNRSGRKIVRIAIVVLAIVLAYLIIWVLFLQPVGLERASAGERFQDPANALSMLR